VVVSAIDHSGIDELRTTLDDVLAQSPSPPSSGRVRFWVDRVFTRTGAGTVVTGTLASGTIPVGAGDDEQPGLDAECGDGVAVVVGLGTPPLVGGHDEQDDRRRSQAGQHVRDEPLVTGDVDESHIGAGRQCRPGEAEVDGQAAASFLLPPVRFDAGQSPHQCGLAVVHVSGGGDHVFHEQYIMR
jgi:hypothetical protein